MDGNLAVARVSKEVGYASVSHFISEFRGRFGVTPRAYCDMNALNRELGTQRAGTPAGAGPRSDKTGIWLIVNCFRMAALVSRNPICRTEWATAQQEADIATGRCRADAMTQ